MTTRQKQRRDSDEGDGDASVGKRSQSMQQVPDDHRFGACTSVQIMSSIARMLLHGR